MLDEYVKKILNARVYEAARETPLELAQNLSSRIGNEIWIKREDLQPVFSFKLRGAYNKIVQLSEEELARGVICASAGNHAQGVAESARLLNIKATIVMPKTTPDIKVDAVRSRGGKVVLHGDAYDDAYAYSQKLVKEKNLVYIHPYDDEFVIAGQGTIAREILQHMRNPIDAIFVPVGGGGLAAGVTAYVKHLRPEIKVIAVEFEESACLAAAVKAGERVVLPQVGIFADGVAVAQIGEKTFEVLQHNVDEVITVNVDEICAAIKDIFDDTRSITEPAGAIAVAGAKKYSEKNQLENQRMVAICSGANMNFDRLRYVAEQAEVGEHREALMAVTIPEQPGSFKKFIDVLGKRSITEFNYRYGDQQNAKIFVGIRISGLEEKNELIEALQQAELDFHDLTGDETAKSHIRHMVGGRAQAENERLLRFEFPERPGALLNFLRKLGGKWNISLFHYRNHGAAYGKVLAGLQVPEPELELLEQKLTELGYLYWHEDDNLAYQQFL